MGYLKSIRSCLMPRFIIHGKLRWEGLVVVLSVVALYVFLTVMRDSFVLNR